MPLRHSDSSSSRLGKSVFGCGSSSTGSTWWSEKCWEGVRGCYSGVSVSSIMSKAMHGNKFSMPPDCAFFWHVKDYVGIEPGILSDPPVLKANDSNSLITIVMSDGDENITFLRVFEILLSGDTNSNFTFCFKADGTDWIKVPIWDPNRSSSLMSGVFSILN